MKSNLCGRAAGYLVALLVASSLAGCGGPADDAGGKSKAAVRLDACRILRDVGPEKILGEPADSGTLLVEVHMDDMSSSQCQFAATGSDRTVSLLIQWAKGKKAPASRQAYFDEIRKADDLGVGAETVESLQSGREIAGLGDMALTYDLFTFNLMVWSGEYSFTVMLHGFGSGDDAEARVLSVAKSVLARL